MLFSASLRRLVLVSLLAVLTTSGTGVQAASCCEACMALEETCWDECLTECGEDVECDNACLAGCEQQVLQCSVGCVSCFPGGGQCEGSACTITQQGGGIWFATCRVICAEQIDGWGWFFTW